MENKVITVSDIIINAKARRLRLPDFQRDEVWKPSEKAYLVESIIKEYPVGSLLFLHSSHEDFKLPSKSIHRDSEDLDEGGEFNYILDGQQRILSLYRVLTLDGSELLYKDKKFHYMLNLEAWVYHSIDPNYDHEERLVVDFEKKKNQSLESKDYKFMPMFWLFEKQDDKINYKYDEEIKNHIKAFVKRRMPDGDSEPKNDFFKKLKSKFPDNSNAKEFSSNELDSVIKIKSDLSRIQENINKYGIPVTSLGSKDSLNGVVTIFETINNTGAKLTSFDLVAAKLSAKNIEIKKFINELNADYFEGIEIEPDWLINTIAYLDQMDAIRKYNEENPSVNKKYYLLNTQGKLIKTLTPEVVKRYLPGVIPEDLNKNFSFNGTLLDSYIDVYNWVNKLFVNTNNLIRDNLIQFLVIAQVHFKILDLVHDKYLKAYLLHRLLTVDNYNRSAITDDIRMINEFNNKITASPLEFSKKDEKSRAFLETIKEFKTSSGAKIYEPIEIKSDELFNISYSDKTSKRFLVFSNIINTRGVESGQEIKDWGGLSLDKNVDYHHIVPKAYIEEMSQTSPTTLEGVKQIEKLKSIKNSLPNLIWQNSFTNQQVIGKEKPRVYFKKFLLEASKKGVLDECVKYLTKNSFIPGVYLMQNDYGFGFDSDLWEAEDEGSSINKCIKFLDARCKLIAVYLNEYFNELNKPL